MGSALEFFGVRTRGLETTSKPFESWAGSPVKGWPIRMRMLNMGDLADIAKLTATVNPVEASYLSKIYLLSKCILTINGNALVTTEDVEAYNKEHNLAGNQKLDMFGYKILFVRKLSEAVVNKLVFAYDELQDEYLSQHLGRVLPDELKAATVSGVDLSNVSPPQTEEEKSHDIDSGGDVSNP